VAGGAGQHQRGIKPPALLTTTQARNNDQTARYDEFNRRLRATVLPINSKTLRTSVQQSPMCCRGNGFYGGSASCLPGTTLTGGGVDWGFSPRTVARSSSVDATSAGSGSRND
jgi:hypothetical protein